jgi:hypothetical protein
MATIGKDSSGTIRYYAVALNADRKTGQLLVTKPAGKRASQEWTGITCKVSTVAIG